MTTPNKVYSPDEFVARLKTAFRILEERITANGTDTNDTTPTGIHSAPKSRRIGIGYTTKGKSRVRKSA